MKRLFLITAILFLCSVIVNAGELQNIKIAVASNDKNTEASISNKAAKCPYYLIFDGNGKLIQVLENQYRNANRGAGPSAVNFLSQMRVTVVVAENFGSKMINALQNKGITHIEFKGKVGDAVKRALDGR
ncbi:MAG TPA: NifB/NifX family molybdenum-iron cluster-binding protein [Desulfobacteraceae bacterium]|nr:NifB/NifX family molybdenum-iron cluster-binding protein [Desulfobacteraceae bacterium]HPJ67278.1 NifB/NifX family molybdenum-iron cluster-binding protein [Desulfobacteraceae bacterium]